MHYHAEVWIARKEGFEKQVEELLAPYQELDDYRELPFHWDWYQIGGRWKGAHVQGYDADKDSEHQTQCSLCGGSGIRPGGLEQFGPEWYEANKGCNGCQGAGSMLTWPTSWQPHPLDVIPVDEIQDELDCHTFVVPEGAFTSEVKNPAWDDSKSFAENSSVVGALNYQVPNPEFDGKVAKFLALRGIRVGYLVTVDYHS